MGINRRCLFDVTKLKFVPFPDLKKNILDCVLALQMNESISINVSAAIAYNTLYKSFQTEPVDLCLNAGRRKSHHLLEFNFPRGPVRLFCSSVVRFVP